MTCVNVDVTIGLTVIVIVVGVKQPAPDGANV